MGKLSTGIFLILMVGLVLVSKANGNDEQKLPLYTSYGISPGGFGIYDRQFPGAGGYLSMPAISPFYLSQAISNFGRGLILDDKLKKIEW